MEDKRIEEIKDMMYFVTCNCGYTVQVEAAKAYAMLCIAQQKENKVVSTYNHIDGTKTAVFGNPDVPTYKITE